MRSGTGQPYFVTNAFRSSSVTSDARLPIQRFMLSDGVAAAFQARGARLAKGRLLVLRARLLLRRRVCRIEHALLDRPRIAGGLVGFLLGGRLTLGRVDDLLRE